MRGSNRPLPARASVDLPVVHLVVDIARRLGPSCMAHEENGYEEDSDGSRDQDQEIHVHGLPLSPSAQTRGISVGQGRLGDRRRGSMAGSVFGVLKDPFPLLGTIG